MRRSISTSYYALFHFLIEEAAVRLLGSGGPKLRRRRILARTFMHKGLRTALNKMQGQNVDRSIEDFMRGPTTTVGPVASPTFAREIARVFADAQAKRHDADYDRNKALSASDARLLRARVQRAIAGWRAATSPADRDFKQAACMLMLLKGQLRQDD